MDDANKRNDDLLKSMKLIQDSRDVKKRKHIGSESRDTMDLNGDVTEFVQRLEIENDLMHERTISEESITDSSTSSSVKIVSRSESINSDNDCSDDSGYLDIHKNCVSKQEVNKYLKDANKKFDDFRIALKERDGYIERFIVKTQSLVKENESLKERNKSMQTEMMKRTMSHIEEIRELHEKHKNKLKQYKEIKEYENGLKW